MVSPYNAIKEYGNMFRTCEKNIEQQYSAIFIRIVHVYT